MELHLLLGDQFGQRVPIGGQLDSLDSLGAHNELLHWAHLNASAAKQRGKSGNVCPFGQIKSAYFATFSCYTCSNVQRGQEHNSQTASIWPYLVSFGLCFCPFVCATS